MNGKIKAANEVAEQMIKQYQGPDGDSEFHGIVVEAIAKRFRELRGESPIKCLLIML